MQTDVDAVERLWPRVEWMAVRKEAEEEQTIGRLHIRPTILSRHGSPFVPPLPLDRSIESGNMADLVARLANHCKVVLERRKRSECRGHVVTKCNKSNFQIGSLQIDVHEPTVRLSQAVISIEEGDRHPNLVWKAGEICYSPRRHARNCV